MNIVEKYQVSFNIPLNIPLNFIDILKNIVLRIMISSSMINMSQSTVIIRFDKVLKINESIVLHGIQ